MSLHSASHRFAGLLPRHSAAAPADAVPATASATTSAGYALAALRLATGFVFLWAFLDKLFGLGYATPSARSWLHGGSPTKGFLSSVQVGPLQHTFHRIAGAAWADWLFMLGLAGIGLAVVLGIALRPAAAAGALLLALMWLAEFPPARHLTGGAPTMSSNPFADYHLLYAVALIALAAASSGNTLGLGRAWARLPWVRSASWLR